MTIARLLLPVVALAFASTASAQISGSYFNPADATAELRKIGQEERLPSSDPMHYISMLIALREMSEAPRGIEELRRLDDLDVVTGLIKLANLDSRPVRIEASLALVNIVDNTTLCAVIDRLLRGDLNDDLQFNLLQVTKVVASYARKENRDWISRMLNLQRSTLAERENEVTSYEKTLQLMDEIEEVLASSAPADDVTFADKYPAQFRACRGLAGIEMLESQER